MKFKAIVKDKETKKRQIIEVEANSKKECMDELRRNGYSLSNKKVLEAKLFDHVMYELGKCDTQYEMDLVWKIRSFDETYETVMEKEFQELDRKLFGDCE